MKIAIISGSPRVGQNSEKIVEYVNKSLIEKEYNTELILLREKKVGFCIHCNGCLEGVGCSTDKIANEVNDVLSKADGIIVVTPVYFGDMTAQVKAMIDKTLPLRRQGMKLQGKVGGAIAVGNSRNGGQELALKNVQSWMHFQGMVVVGDNSHHGGTIHYHFQEDSEGKKTVDGVITAMDDLLKRLK